MSVEAYLLGSTGRRPFAGHFRGRAALDQVRIAWAGRVGSGGSPVEAWNMAEAVRDALATWPGGRDRTDGLEQIWLCLHRMERTILSDLAVLFAVEDAEGGALSACGLSMVYTRGATGLRPLLSQDHPLLSEPGLPDAPAFYFPAAPGPWYGQVHGTALPTGDLDRLVGRRP